MMIPWVVAAGADCDCTAWNEAGDAVAATDGEAITATTTMAAGTAINFFMTVSFPWT
jgi:hypothetical protein